MRALAVQTCSRSFKASVFSRSRFSPDLAGGIRSSMSCSVLRRIRHRRCRDFCSPTSPCRHFIPIVRTTTSPVPHAVDPCASCWLRRGGRRLGSRVDRSGRLAPFVPTPPSQSHPKVIPFHSAVGQDCTALTRFSCANLSASAPTLAKIMDTTALSKHGIPAYKEDMVYNGV